MSKLHPAACQWPEMLAVEACSRLWEAKPKEDVRHLRSCVGLMLSRLQQVFL